uniref:Uncharacterized protein n=1 Tax=Arundo donax TaxID=35708 RepID=A0A0A8Y363_ARUDO
MELLQVVRWYFTLFSTRGSNFVSTSVDTYEVNFCHKKESPEENPL